MPGHIAGNQNSWLSMNWRGVADWTDHNLMTAVVKLINGKNDDAWPVLDAVVLAGLRLCFPKIIKSYNQANFGRQQGHGLLQ